MIFNRLWKYELWVLLNNGRIAPVGGSDSLRWLLTGIRAKYPDRAWIHARTDPAVRDHIKIADDDERKDLPPQ